jgi:hypothetical protein
MLGRRRSPLGYLIGFALTAIVAVVGWLVFGQRILDSIDSSNARSGGGGPPGKRIVSARRFTPVVARVRKAIGPEARLVSVTMRPQSVEFVAVVNRVASGYRWREGYKGLQRFEVGGSGAAGTVDSAPWPVNRLDPRAPERLTKAISAAEDGDFHLSIGDLQRADSGSLVWVMRGTIGERGVAWFSPPDGRGAKPYDPSSPELSRGARLGQCISKAGGDVAKVQRCVRLYSR